MGYSFRFSFEDFCDRYKVLGPTSSKNKKDSGIQLLQYIPKHFPNSQGQFQQGKTKIFLKNDLVFIFLDFIYIL